ncbi:MAG: hypothetical protein EOO67_08645 [Microbacterium sp.]|nr:MAG: hypothetical protein EOO67_08645 [Microbacterium sp.]
MPSRDRRARPRPPRRGRARGHSQLWNRLGSRVDRCRMTIVEVECPRGQTRRRGKSDPIDARLAALQVLRMSEDRKALPRSDGDREAIRILLGARHDMTVARTAQINRLRALLLTGDDEDRLLARVTMTEHNLGAIARRRGRTGESTETQVRRAEARRSAPKRADSRWRSVTAPAPSPTTSGSCPNWSRRSRADSRTNSASARSAVAS